jgi:hypothetical protein
MRGMETTAVATLDRVEVIHDGRVDDPADRRREGERLAAALGSLIARDDAPPPLWLTPTFSHGVDAIRASLTGIESTNVLIRSARGMLDPVDDAGTPFALVAQRLARDPAAVALAVRWLEIDRATALPSWPELVRRRSIEPVEPTPARDAEIWFG